MNSPREVLSPNSSDMMALSLWWCSRRSPPAQPPAVGGIQSIVYECAHTCTAGRTRTTRTPSLTGGRHAVPLATRFLHFRRTWLGPKGAWCMEKLFSCIFWFSPQLTEIQWTSTIVLSLGRARQWHNIRVHHKTISNKVVNVCHLPLLLFLCMWVFCCWCFGLGC